MMLTGRIITEHDVLNSTPQMIAQYKNHFAVLVLKFMNKCIEVTLFEVTS